MVNRALDDRGQTTAFDAFARIFTHFNSLHPAASSSSQHAQQLDAEVDRAAALDHDHGLVVNVASVLGDLYVSL